jgi:hypothetical protein
MHEITSIQSTPVDVESVRCIEGFAHIKGEFPLYLSDESKLSAGRSTIFFSPPMSPSSVPLSRKWGNEESS